MIRETLFCRYHKRTEFGEWKFRVTPPPRSSHFSKKYLFAFLFFLLFYSHRKTFSLSLSLSLLPSLSHYSPPFYSPRTLGGIIRYPYPSTYSHCFIFKLHAPLILAAYSSFVQQKTRMYISSRQEKKIAHIQ